MSPVAVGGVFAGGWDSPEGATPVDSVRDGALEVCRVATGELIEKLSCSSTSKLAIV